MDETEDRNPVWDVAEIVFVGSCTRDVAIYWIRKFQRAEIDLRKANERLEWIKEMVNE